jgi:cob(I)alamin adenosyltransferase
MKIYTKGGDAGETGLYGGSRIPKDHQRLHTYGTLDELNAALGLALAETDLSAQLRARLLRVQNELFQIGAELATPAGKSSGLAVVEETQVTELELEIDEMEAKLQPLKNFILPGGSRSSALLHLARTVSRRGERELITLHRAEPLRPALLKYVNRLSDYLFVCARFANFENKVPDTAWVKR